MFDGKRFWSLDYGVNLLTLPKTNFLITNLRRRIATLRPFGKYALAICCPFVSTHSQRISDDFSAQSPSNRFRRGALSCRLSRVCSLAAFLFLLLPGLVLAQVSEHASSKEAEFKKERGWGESITSMRVTAIRDYSTREERFRLESEAYGLVHGRLWSELPVERSSAEKPVAHMSMNICDRTPVVMDAILSRIPATNDCSEVTSTQLAAITDTLDLSQKRINILKAGDFEGLISLNTLNLGQNALSTLPDGIFDELASLTALVLQSNRLRSFPHGIFDEMSLLNRLELSNNALATLPDGVFDELASLAELILAANDLTTLPRGIFDELTSLTWLSLGANDLSALPDGIFDELTSLTGLGLGANDLSTLPDGIFDELTLLTGLDLWRNDLSTLPDGIFDELTLLTWLELGDNDLSALPDGIFDKLTALTELDLGRNDLSTLPDGIFDELILLTWLRLDENDMSTLPGGIFDELVSLAALWLDENDMSTLSDGIFDGLTSLIRLQLQDNDLSTLPDGIFDELTSLTVLDLGGSDLSTLSDGIFDELTSLTLLDLGYNRLSTLPDGIFDELTSLTGLDLGGNDLSTLQDGIFYGLAKLSLKDSVLSFPAGLSLEANPGAPFSPVVDAGADLTVQPGAAVSISGSVTGPWGDFVRWDWTQVVGPDSDVPISGALPLTGGDTALPIFTTPTAEGELYFKLLVAPGHRGDPTEAYGHAYSAPDWVTVTVSNTPTNTSETLSVVDFNLLGNYPNPFNPSTTILLDLPQAAVVIVDLFNVLGQQVHREEFPTVAAGVSKSLLLDVSHLSSGAYTYQVTARMGKEVHRAGGRMTLIK